MFGHEAAAGAALDAYAATHIEILAAVVADVFERAWAFPGHTFGLRIGPYAVGAEHVRPRHHDAQSWNASQVVAESIAIKRILGDGGIQRVIPGRAARPISVG